MATFDWDKTITVKNDDEVDVAVAVTTNNVKNKQIQETIKFKSPNVTKDLSHAANISANERADNAKFHFQAKHQLKAEIRQF